MNMKQSRVRWATLAAAVVFVGSLAAAVWFYATRAKPVAMEPASGMTCDMGISAAKAGRGTDAGATAQPVGSGSRADPSPPPGPAPEGMTWIPGGEFWMGADDFPDAQPWHRVYLNGFWIDKTEVTNEQFAKFVKATGYVTVAERTPRAEDFPGAPPENLVAGSVVFSPPDHPVKLNNHFQWWSYVKGADWRHPEGPKSTIKDRGKYPVVHIAYEDALAYAKWAGKRLPTEAEFEFAQRGGRYELFDPVMTGGGLVACGKRMKRHGRCKGADHESGGAAQAAA